MLIIVAHGSRDPSWRASVEGVAESLRAGVGPHGLRLAYMDHGPPTLDDAVSAAYQAGTRRFRVLPLFLADEGHVERDIRPAVERLRAELPSAEIELLPAVGQHRLFLEMLAEIAKEESGPQA